MRILHIGKFYPPFFGGVEKVNFDLVERLNQKSGCEVDELCFAHEVDYVETFIPNGYRLFRVPIWFVTFSTPLPKGFVRTFFRIRKDYDIIHVHVPNPIASLVSLFAPKKAKIIIHWHSDIIKQKNLLKVFRPIQTVFLKRADAIIATSQKYVDASRWLKPFISKVVVVPIGLDPLEMVYNQDDVYSIRKQYEGKKLLLCIGRLTLYKGHKNLIEAVKKLNDNVVLLIGGVGEMEEELKHSVAQLNLEDRVKFIGRIPKEQIYAYYKAADVFCLPSVTKAEAFGVVLLESLAMGTPIVTCNIEGSGVPWVNKDGETGYNVPVNDPDALADKLRLILQNEELRKNMSMNCVKRFKKLFTLDKMVEAVYSLYKKVIEVK